MMQLCGTVAVILATVEAMDAETENKPETTETPSSSSPGQEADMMNPLAETIEYTCAHSDDPRVVKLDICCGTSTNGRNYVWWNNSWTCVCCASTRFCVNYEKCRQGRTNRGFTCTTGGFANDQDVDGWIRKGNSNKWKCKECVKIKTCVRCSKDSKNIGEFCDRKYPESYPIGWRYETSDGEKRWHCNECLKKSYICVNTGEDSASSKCAGISEEKDAYFLMKEDKGWKCTECARIKYTCVAAGCQKPIQWIYQTNDDGICDGIIYGPQGWRPHRKSGKERWHCQTCLKNIIVKFNCKCGQTTEGIKDGGKFYTLGTENRGWRLHYEIKSDRNFCNRTRIGVWECPTCDKLPAKFTCCQCRNVFPCNKSRQEYYKKEDHWGDICYPCEQKIIKTFNEGEYTCVWESGPMTPNADLR